jgi:hypothetical protein
MLTVILKLANFFLTMQFFEIKLSSPFMKLNSFCLPFHAVDEFHLFYNVGVLLIELLVVNSSKNVKTIHVTSISINLPNILLNCSYPTQINGLTLLIPLVKTTKK